MHETKHRALLAGWSFAVAACSTGHAPETSTEVSDLDQIVQPLEDHIRHVLIYHEPGYFAAWPANHGIWAWGNEIVVGFERAAYDADPDQFHHTQGESEVFLARSTDGGEHWKIEKRDELDVELDHDDEPSTVGRPPLDWANPHFGLKLLHNGYWLTETRGHIWQGPFAVPDFDHEHLSGRTALLQVPSGKTWLFMSVMDGSPCDYAYDNLPDDGNPVREGDVARTMIFSTDDEGQSFEDVNWVAPRPGSSCVPSTTTGASTTGSSCILSTGSPPPTCPARHNYSIMPSPVLLDDGTVVVALRERAGPASRVKVVANCREAAYSCNSGSSFSARSIPIDAGPENLGPNNPGSLVKLQDGRIALVYADRRTRNVSAKLSTDGGYTWGPAFVLTEVAANQDMGYVQAVTRSDGKVVVVYYFTTAERPEQHIRATIWTPDGVTLDPPGTSLSESLITSVLYSVLTVSYNTALLGRWTEVLSAS